MCAGTLQEGNVIQEAYNFNHPLTVIQTAYSGTNDHNTVVSLYDKDWYNLI